AVVRRARSDLDRRHVLGARTLRALHDLELDLGALFERPVPLSLDIRVVHEQVLASVRGDEAETLRDVEPLNSAGSHFFTSPVLVALGRLDVVVPSSPPPTEATACFRRSWGSANTKGSWQGSDARFLATGATGSRARVRWEDMSATKVSMT